MVSIFPPLLRNMFSTLLSGIAELSVNLFHFKLFVPNRFQLITEGCTYPCNRIQHKIGSDKARRKKKKQSLQIRTRDFHHL